MHTVYGKSKNYKLSVNHNGDWSGEAIISWSALEGHETFFLDIDARDLLRGHFDLTQLPMGSYDATSSSDPTIPLEVATCAVSLAVDSWWLSNTTSKMEDLSVGNI